MVPRKSRVLSCLALAVLVACTGGSRVPAAGPSSRSETQLSQAASPLASGQIAFSRGAPGANTLIYVMKPDGSDVTKISDLSGVSPSWSSDGSHLAFVHPTVDGRDSVIYVVNMEDYGIRGLTGPGAEATGPAWSPDGSKLAFESGLTGRGDIYVIGSDGSGQKRLTADPHADADPAWSPDGSKIAFVSDRAPGGGFDLYLMDAGGSNVVRLASDAGEERDPAWSPDGRKIAFDLNDHIYVVGSAGGRTTELVEGVRPAWSPDGTALAFELDARIYVMEADGTHMTRLTDSGAEDASPSWGPA
jgi:Tol biopolymer transport system component